MTRETASVQGDIHNSQFRLGTCLDGFARLFLCLKMRGDFELGAKQRQELMPVHAGRCVSIKDVRRLLTGKHFFKLDPHPLSAHLHL